jgi:hypothetical protein
MYRSHDSDMCPISLAAYHQQMLGLSLLLHSYVGRETEVGPVGHSVGLRGGVGSTFFLGSSSIRPALLMTRERLLYMDRVWKVGGVLVGFSPAGYTSIRIVCSWKSSHS